MQIIRFCFYLPGALRDDGHRFLAMAAAASLLGLTAV